MPDADAEADGGGARLDLLPKVPKGGKVIHLYTGEGDFELKRQLRSVAQQFAAKFGAENIERVNLQEADHQQVVASLTALGLFSKTHY